MDPRLNESNESRGRVEGYAFWGGMARMEAQGQTSLAVKSATRLLGPGPAGIPSLDSPVPPPHLTWSLYMPQLTSPQWLLLLLSPSVTSDTATPQTESSVPGILQAGTLEWVAISFSNA